MSTKVHTSVLGTDVDFVLSGPWTDYWIATLRLITGWWLFHAGLGKFVTDGGFDAGWWLAQEGTVVAPITNWFGANAPGVVNVMIPLGELLIGLGLLVGAFTRLAAFFGAFLMTFLYLGNADWSHGFVNGDLMGVLLFGTVLVFGAGRVWGIDRHLEQLAVVKNNRWLRYVLG